MNLPSTLQRVLADMKKRGIVIGYREGDAFKEAPELMPELLTESLKEAFAATEQDYIKWCRAPLPDKYDGETPFPEWRKKAEAEEMKNWK